MAWQRFLTLTIIALLWNALANSESSPLDGAVESSDFKAYNDTKNESELYNLILEKDFRGALDRLNEVPIEANILIEVLGGAKGLEVIKTGLPLHFVFDVDLPQNLPNAERKAPMCQAQVDLVHALLRVNPLAAAQKDNFSRLPLYIALISPVPPAGTVISTMVQLYPDAVRIQALQGLTPLHMAVSYPMTSLENIKIILSEFPEAVEAFDDDKSLPIHLAAWGGNFPESKAVIELLLNQNATHLFVSDGDHETILSLMTKYGRTSDKALGFVLQQDSQSVYTMHDKVTGNSALHDAVIASIQQNNTIYKPLVENHKDLLKKSNHFGRLPIHEALLRCCANVEMILDLIQGFPLSASMRDGLGYLPLHHACNAGVADASTVQALIDASPLSVKVKINSSNSNSGPLPLHLALSHGDTHGEVYSSMNSVTELLLSQYPEGARVKDPDGDVPPLVQAFLSRRSAAVLKKIMQFTPTDVATIVQIKQGGEIKSTTLLHLFAEYSHGYMKPDDIDAIIEVFVAMDPTLFHRTDSDGRLPLHMVWKQEGTIEESRQKLVDTLLAQNPDAVRVADKDNLLPLAYVARARDQSAFEKIFPLNPFAAAIRSVRGSYPLHFLCSSQANVALSASIDNMIMVLLNQYPAAAREADDDGNLPLHFLCQTAGAGHVEPHILQKLIVANPVALNIVHENQMLPLQLAVLSAATSNDAVENSYWAPFVETLVDENPLAVSEVSAGKLPLPAAIDKLETLSIYRRQENDHMLRIVRRLYDVYPNAIANETKKERNGLHTLLTLLGDMGGMTPTGWSDLTIQVIHDFPELANQKDIHARTPLHLFCLYLGDTAIGLRENQDPRTRKNVQGIEGTFVALIMANPDALEQADQYLLTPSELVSHDRLRFAKGGKRFYNAELLNMMKHHLRRGTEYWKMRKAIETAETCADLRRALEEVKEQVQSKLDDLAGDPSKLSFQGYTCDARNAKLCQSCEAEQEFLGAVENALSAYGDAMEQMGKDAAEISGAYYPGGYSY